MIHDGWVLYLVGDCLMTPALERKRLPSPCPRKSPEVNRFDLQFTPPVTAFFFIPAAITNCNLEMQR